MTKMEFPPWLVYPGSRVKLHFTAASGPGELAVLCNPQGLASLSSVLLWLAGFTDPRGLSISALPFVSVEGSLAFSVVMAMKRDGYQGRVVRVDRASEFEWQIQYEDLREVAIDLHRVASNPEYVNWFRLRLTPDSHASVSFEITAPAEGG